MLPIKSITPNKHTRLSEQLSKLPQDLKVHLLINKLLTEEELSNLKNYSEEHYPLPFKKLSIHVDNNLIQSESFIELIKELNAASLSAVELVFSNDELTNSGDELVQILTKTIAPHTEFPLQIRVQKDGEIIPTSLYLKDFHKQVISNIQKRNQDPNALKKVAIIDKKFGYLPESMNEPIKLKQLISNKLKKKNELKENDVSQYIHMEVEHVEVIQQEIAIEEQIQLNNQMQETQQYSGTLIGFKEFMVPVYQKQVERAISNSEERKSLYALLEQELFANLPHAIKYISPEAAEQLALNLPNLVTLNKENLPHGFELKKTDKHEWVLDYDRSLENERVNPFTPKINSLDNEDALYDIELKQEDFERWVGSNDEAKLFSDTAPKQLSNMWVKYGDTGVKTFFESLRGKKVKMIYDSKTIPNFKMTNDDFFELNKSIIKTGKNIYVSGSSSTNGYHYLYITWDGIEENKPELLDFLIKNYLNHFPQWDHLYNNHRFFNATYQINQYDETKLHWFKQFLVNTGSSRHDLAKTVTSFEFFWIELSALCEEKKLPLELLKTAEWTTPKGGDPAVYMERMLGVLKNAHNLEEQLKNLSSNYLKKSLETTKNVDEDIRKHLFNNMGPLSLDNYGASYASKYEDFKNLSALMRFDYDPKWQNAIPFKEDYLHYRTDLNKLIEGRKKSKRYNNYCHIFESKVCWTIKSRKGYITSGSSYCSFWLVDSEQKINTYDELQKLKHESKAIEFDGTDVFDERQFIAPYELYAVWDEGKKVEFIVDEKPWSLSYYNALAYRFLGQQTEGILFSSFIEQYLKFVGSNSTSYELSQTTLMMLFFVSHQRYVGDTPLRQLFANLDSASKSEDVVIQAMTQLSHLYSLDFKLNEYEGLILSSSMSGMNRWEFEKHPFKREDAIKQMLDCIQSNKFAMQKLLHYSKKYNPKWWPLAYGIETAEFLARDPVVAEGYRDDLFLFSGMLTMISSEAYYHERVKNKEQIIEWLTQVRNYLHQACVQEKPNNLQYAIQALLNAKQLFPFNLVNLVVYEPGDLILSRDSYNGIFSHFLTAFDEIATLKSFSSWEVESILKKNKFKLGAELPDVFTKDNDDLKGLMIALIMQLDKGKKLQGKQELGEDVKDLNGLMNETEDMSSSSLYKELTGKTITELGETLKEKWNESGTFLSLVGKQFLKGIINQLKEIGVNSAFESPKKDKNKLLELMHQKIGQVPDLQDWSDFDKLKNIIYSASTIAGFMHSISSNPAVEEHEEEFVTAFTKLDCSKTPYTVLYGMLNLFIQMPQRNYLALLNRFSNNLSFFADQRHFQIFLKAMLELNQHYFPTNYLDSFAQFMEKNPQQIKKCMLIQMEESPTLNTLEIKNENQYIIAEKEIWYFEASENSLKKLDALNKKLISSLLDKLKIEKDRLATKDELSLITSYTGHTEPAFNSVMGKLIKIYELDSDDPILNWMMSHPNTPYDIVSQLLSICEGVTTHRDKVAVLLTSLSKDTKKVGEFINALNGSGHSAAAILEIIGKSHAILRSNESKKPFTHYTELVSQLSALAPEHIKSLYSFCETTPVSLECLHHALKKPGVKDDFATFLLEFEKAPFGARDIKKQFDVSEVEREVNGARDLLNDTVPSFTYRKKMMEAFLFVNQIGEDLAVYNKKPIKELSNLELQAFFEELKHGTKKTFAHLTAFQRRLLALGVMREAMYRATGEFAYSKQVLDLIDAMMHEGDLIANIDTGQGKSLIDYMKSALLYLDSERVYLTTSSLVDAKRDIANYGPFLKLLGIPYSERAISSTSSIDDVATDGINFSTVAQLSLFFAKLELMDKSIGTELDKESLVVNESDYTILDDRVTYRFATSEGVGINVNQTWIYEGINEFVTGDGYVFGDSTAAEDVKALMLFLKLKGQGLKKSTHFLDNFDAEQYKTWIESSLVVNYHLKEHIDYVIPEGYEKKMINNVECRTRVAKLLMSDGKVSPDSMFGAAVQQLLYAKLNKHANNKAFIIEPQTKTIISSNNKNLLDRFRLKKGFIWGSSGTVGSHLEIKEQYKKYGFEFTKSEPHQKNKVKVHQPKIYANETAQFEALIRQVTYYSPHKNSPPNIIFCKDIPTAKKLHELLQQKNAKKYPTQLYTGVGKEEEFIQNASQPGMITVTTTALGRNTDIDYDKKVGLKVWHTHVDSTRNTGQKGGRTGRQGSEGEEHWILNKEELGGKTLQEITQEMDNVSANERRVNEEFYDVLGYLFGRVTSWDSSYFLKGKPGFLKEGWSIFSLKCEQLYHQSRRNKYIREEYIKTTLDLFHTMVNEHLSSMPEEVTADEITLMLNQSYSKKVSYVAFEGKVSLSDCTPPVTIAYHLIDYTSNEEDSVGTQKRVQNHLTQMFSKIKKGYACPQHSEYINYLNRNPTSKKEVVLAHKQFLSQYLKTHSHQPTWAQRWLGYEGQLNKVVGNSNYLMMFQAFSCLSDEPVVEPDVLKDAINALLDTYTQTSWFINRERRDEALKLRVNINKANTLDELIDLINKSQLDAIKHDVTRNKESKIRAIKPLNLFGRSRYQDTLKHALDLVTSLDTSERANKYSKELTIAAGESEDTTLDAVKHKKKEHRLGTKRVILDSLEHSLQKKNERKEPLGMTGRKQGLFQQKEDIKKKEELQNNELQNNDEGDRFNNK
jgi:hypothetical protein